MQTRSPFRRLVASVALTSLFTGTVSPWASAQTAQTNQAAPKATEQPAKAAPKASGSAAPATAPAPTAPAPAAPTPAAPKAGTPAPAATTATPPAATTSPAPEAGTAGPDEATRERARTSFQAAQQAYGEGNYQQAYEQFLVAYEAIPSPHAEYWIAKSLDGMGDRSADAARAYRTFLANPNAAQVGEEKLAEAKTRFEALRATLPARLTITTDPAGAGVTVDGAPAQSPSPVTVELAPGAHKLEVTLDGYEKTALDVSLQGGDELEHRIKLQSAEKPVAVATPPASVAATPEKAERSMVPAYVTLGLAGAGIAVGTVFGVMALNDKSDFDDNPTTDKADEVERNALISDMAFGVALTLGITGVVLLTSSDDEPEAKQTASKDKLVVAPFVTPKAGGAAARWTF